MDLPFTFPDWMPWWLQLLVVVVGLLLLLALLLMPFSVFGVKSRLETIEARLDEIQGEIRRLALRLPEPGVYEQPDTVTRATAPLSAPPIPPAAWEARQRNAGRAMEAPRPRAEPRLERPR